MHKYRKNLRKSQVPKVYSSFRILFPREIPSAAVGTQGIAGDEPGIPGEVSEFAPGELGGPRDQAVLIIGVDLRDDQIVLVDLLDDHGMLVFVQADMVAHPKQAHVAEGVEGSFLPEYLIAEETGKAKAFTQRVGGK